MFFLLKKGFWHFYPRTMTHILNWSSDFNVLLESGWTSRGNWFLTFYGHPMTFLARAPSSYGQPHVISLRTHLQFHPINWNKVWSILYLNHLIYMTAKIAGTNDQLPKLCGQDEHCCINGWRNNTQRTLTSYAIWHGGITPAHQECSTE